MCKSGKVVRRDAKGPPGKLLELEKKLNDDRNMTF